MTYADFLEELAKDFLYDAYHIAYYGNCPPLNKNLRVIDTVVGKERNCYICSLFRYFDPYVFWKEGMLGKWEYNAVLFWAASELHLLLAQRIDDGWYPDDLWDDPKEISNTLRNLAIDYRNIFNELSLASKRKLCYTYKVMKS